KRQADLVAFDLDVFFLHEVEQTDLNFFGQVGQLIDGEDAPIGARHQAVVNRFLVGEVAALGDLDRVDFADQIGDGDIGGRQRFTVGQIASDPLERQCVAQLGRFFAADAADRVVRVVVDLATLHNRNSFIE